MEQKEGWMIDKSLLETNHHMLHYEIATDITFLVGDVKQEMRAHKFMLMSRSAIMFTTLETHSDSDTDLVVRVPDITPETFKDVLLFIYTEQVNLDATNVTGLLYAARRFKLHDLSSLCFNFLESRMSVKNVCTIYQQAYEYKEKNLSEKCLQFILDHGEEVIQTAAFHDLSVECVDGILKSDDLKAEEERVFDAMMEWATHECRRHKLQPSDETRRQVLGKLLYQIRFTTMDVVNFTQRVSFRDILSNDEAVSIFQYFHGEQQTIANKFNRDERNRLRDRKPLSDRSIRARDKQQRRVTILSPPHHDVTVVPTKRSSMRTPIGIVDTPVVPATPKPPNRVMSMMSRVKRFTSQDGQWKQNGPPDAISFCCSAPIVLHGVEVYGSASQHETYNIKIQLYDDFKEEVRRRDTILSTDIITKTYDVMLARPIRIPPDRVFTVMITMKGSPTVKGVDGTTIHSADGVTFEFINSNRSSNGTDVTIGQIPSLLFNTTE